MIRNNEYLGMIKNGDFRIDVFTIITSIPQFKKIVKEDTSIEFAGVLDKIKEQYTLNFNDDPNRICLFSDLFKSSTEDTLMDKVNKIKEKHLSKISKTNGKEEDFIILDKKDMFSLVRDICAYYINSSIIATFEELKSKDKNKEITVFDVFDSLKHDTNSPVIASVGALRAAQQIKIKTYKDWIDVLYIMNQLYAMSLQTNEALSGSLREVLEDNKTSKNSNKNDNSAQLVKIDKRLKGIISSEAIINKSINDITIKIEDQIKNYSEDIKKEVISICNDQKYDVLENSYKSQIQGLLEQISDIKTNLKLANNAKKSCEVEIARLKKELDNSIVKDKEVNLEIIKEEKSLFNSCENNDTKQIKPKNNRRKAGILFASNPLKVYIPKTGEFVLCENSDKESWYSNGQTVVLNESNKIIKFIDCSFRVTEENVTMFEKYDIMIEENGIKENITDVEISKGFMTPNKKVIITGFGKTEYAKRNKFTLDSYYSFFKNYDIKCEYILSKLGNGYIARNCITGQESYVEEYTLNGKSKQVDIGNVVITSDNNVINVISYNFYLLSSFYDDKLIKGVVCDDLSFIRKTNGEKVKIKINEFITTVKDGDVVVVDEHGNYLYPLDSKAVENEINFKKISASTGMSDKIVTKKTVLILGDVNLRSSYTLMFAKAGIKAITISGYSSFTKIEQTIRKEKPKFIVINTTCCSHANMWDIKSKYDNYIISSNDGASSMLKVVEESVS